MTPVFIPLPSIEIGSRLRPASPPHVEALAASIERAAAAGVGYEGLRTPIEVRAVKRGYGLVSGLHRLEAMRLLGRGEIAAQVLTADAAEAELLEIEENLVRADLTALDRAMHVARYRQMFEAAYGEVRRGGDQRSDQKSNLPLWSDAAKERLGLSGDALKRAQRIASGLDEDSVQRLRGTGWGDNQKFLLEFCGIGLQHRAATLDELLAPGAELSLREAFDKATGREAAAVLPPDEEWHRRSLRMLEEPPARRARLYETLFARDLATLRRAASEAGFEIRPRPLASEPNGEG